MHLRPGGAALFEPDHVQETDADATDHDGHDGADGRALRYLRWRTDPDPSDAWYVDEFAYLLREPGGTTRVAHDVHRLGLFSRATWLRLQEVRLCRLTRCSSLPGEGNGRPEYERQDRLRERFQDGDAGIGVVGVRPTQRRWLSYMHSMAATACRVSGNNAK